MAPPWAKMTMNCKNRQELDELFSITYEELRRLASAVRRGDPSATLNPTALVHEAWLKLANSPSVPTTSPLHFKRIAARAMRQLLVEAARRRKSQKRGGAERFLSIDFSDAGHVVTSCEEDLLALDDALNDLEGLNPRQAATVESRYFGGLAVSETARLLNVSDETVARDWRLAKAWLAHRLRPHQ